MKHLAVPSASLVAPGVLILVFEGDFCFRGQAGVLGDDVVVTMPARFKLPAPNNEQVRSCTCADAFGSVAGEWSG